MNPDAAPRPEDLFEPDAPDGVVAGERLAPAERPMADEGSASAERSAPRPGDLPVPAPPEGGAPGVRSALRSGLPARTTPPPPADRPTIELARRVVELAEDKKAADIVLLDIERLTTIADYLVICSGGSERQLAAIADGIAEGLKADHAAILGREGQPASHWILLDVGSVIVHVFAPPERDFYGLERLWGEARTILRVQ